MWNKNIVGIDIYDDRIIVVRLAKDGSVVALGSRLLPGGLVEHGVIRNCESFSSECESLLRETKPEPILDGLLKPFAYVSLPTPRIFSYSMEIPESIGDKDHQSYIRTESAKIIPVELGRMYVQEYIGTVRGKSIATLVGAPKEIVDTYTSCLSKVGVEVVFVGSRLHAIARALLPAFFAEDHYMLLHVTKEGTTIGVFDQSAVAFATVESFLSAQDLEHAAFEDVTVLADLVTEMRGLQHYFTEKTGQKVTRIILTGTDVDVSKIEIYMKEHIEIPVAQGVLSAHMEDSTTMTTVPDDIHRYSVAVGLALCGINTALPAVNLLPNQYKQTQFIHHSLRFEHLIPQTCKQYLDMVKDLIPHSERTRTLLAATGTGLALSLLVYVLLVYV